MPYLQASHSLRLLLGGSGDLVSRFLVGIRSEAHPPNVVKDGRRKRSSGNIVCPMNGIFGDYKGATGIISGLNEII